MSTINVQSITNGTDTITVNDIDDTVKGSTGTAVAWALTNATAIDKAYNISAITDLGSSVFRLTFTTARTNAIYSPLATIQAPGGDYTAIVTARMTTHFDVLTLFEGSGADAAFSVAVFDS